MEASLASAGVSTGSIAVLYIIYKVFSAIRGHRLISDCCGKFYEIGVDVRDMPPTPPVPGEKQTHLLSSHPKEESSQSQNVSAPKDVERPLDLKKALFDRRHQPQQVAEEGSSHGLFVPSTVESKPSAGELESDSVSSSPPISSE